MKKADMRYLPCWMDPARRSHDSTSYRREARGMEREQTTIRLPKDLKEEIQRKADEEGQSFNSELIILIQKGLKVK